MVTLFLAVVSGLKCSKSELCSRVFVQPPLMCYKYNSPSRVLQACVYKLVMAAADISITYVQGCEIETYIH